MWVDLLELCYIFGAFGCDKSDKHRISSNIISGTAGGRKFRKKNIEPIEMKRLWFDVTYLFEELLNAFDWLPNQAN